MKDIEEFRIFLKRKGMKTHVVDGLVKRCSVFEDFLRNRQKVSMDKADKEDVLAFFDATKDRKAEVGNLLRAVSLYYRFKSKPELSAVASKLREQRISSARKSFELKNFRGINAEYAAKLSAVGVRNAEQLLQLGKTRTDRRKLADKTGIPSEALLEFVKLSDLSRIEGVKGTRARLYYDAGIDTVEKMAKWDSEKLRTYLVDFVNRTGFEGIAPLPKEARNTVEEAKRLPKIIEY